jgi:hypothetical protein
LIPAEEVGRQAVVLMRKLVGTDMPGPNLLVSELREHRSTTGHRVASLSPGRPDDRDGGPRQPIRRKVVTTSVGPQRLTGAIGCSRIAGDRKDSSA